MRKKNLKKQVLNKFAQHKFAYLFAITLVLTSTSGMIVNAKGHKIQAATEEDVNLIKHLAEHPELINIHYLEEYLGPRSQSYTSPSRDASHTMRLITTTSWNSPDGLYTRYRLESGKKDKNDQLAKFNLSFKQEEGLRLKDTDKIFALPSIRSFDHHGHPIDLYTISPSTKISIYQSQGLVGIRMASVEYIGKPLPPPSAIDMQAAAMHKRDLSFKNHEKGNYDQAISLLQAHLQANPYDAEAHLKLAQAYKAKSYLNQSIAEYKAALANCGNNTDLRNQCLEGLRTLKVIPADTSGQPANSIPANIMNNPLNTDVGF